MRRFDLLLQEVQTVVTASNNISSSSKPIDTKILKIQNTTQFFTEVCSHGFLTSAIFAGFLASELKYASNAKLLAYETEICGPMRRKFARIQYLRGEPIKCIF